MRGLQSSSHQYVADCQCASIPSVYRQYTASIPPVYYQITAGQYTASIPPVYYQITAAVYCLYNASTFFSKCATSLYRRSTRLTVDRRVARRFAFSSLSRKSALKYCPANLLPTLRGENCHLKSDGNSKRPLRDWRNDTNWSPNYSSAGSRTARPQHYPTGTLGARRRRCDRTKVIIVSVAVSGPQRVNSTRSA